MVLFFSAVSFTPAEIFEGDQITMSCSVTPKKMGMIRKWEVNGSPITSSSRMQTYTVNKVSQEGAGTWSCVIGNKPNEVKVSTTLRVKGGYFFFLSAMQINKLCFFLSAMHIKILCSHINEG